VHHGFIQIGQLRRPPLIRRHLSLATPVPIVHIQPIERLPDNPAYDHPTEVLPIIAPFWGLAPDVLAKMNRGTNGLTLSPRDIQPLVDAVARYGAISKPFNAAD